MEWRRTMLRERERMENSEARKEHGEFGKQGI